jgi:hypothetical protein
LHAIGVVLEVPAAGDQIGWLRATL